jgi:glutaredoxin 3
MIEVYGRPNCNWCVAAKQLLNEKGINYRYSTVGEDIGINEITEMFPGVRTVPIVAVDGKRIGGYEELKVYLEETAGGFGDGAF